MAWILLAALGVPIWLVLGALGGALWSRSKFRHAPGVFPCKVRLVPGPQDSGKWPRSTAYARWVHDVLLVHAGLALVRFRALPVMGVDGSISPTPGVKVKGGGAVSIRVRLDDGTIADVAGPGSMREVLSGPFLTLHEKTTEAPTA
jgi:hypothetical protein